VPEQGLDEERRREDTADLDHEHDGVSHLVARVELAERVDDGAAHDGWLEERARLSTHAVSAMLDVARDDTVRDLRSGRHVGRAKRRSARCRA
jgi:hypothetical protein